MINAHEAAVRAMTDDVDTLARHAELTLTLSAQEDDDFVDALAEIIHKVTDLPVRIQLRRSIEPYHRGPWPTGPRT